jgi:hypothetical protein
MLAKKFLALVKEKIPGTKILTLVLDDYYKAWDISKEGRVGHDKGHEALLAAKLALGLRTGGGVTIRQFLSLKTEIDGPSGRIFLPVKNLYGFYLGGGTWMGMTGELTERAHNTDSETGLELEKEPAVFYKDAPF